VTRVGRHRRKDHLLEKSVEGIWSHRNLRCAPDKRLQQLVDPMASFQHVANVASPDFFGGKAGTRPSGAKATTATKGYIYLRVGLYIPPLGGHLGMVGMC
jgi:hypothetical protein